MEPPNHGGGNAINAQQIIRAVYTILDCKKGEDIVVLDVRGCSDITDFFVIASGTSLPHLKALANDVQFGLKQLGLPCYRREGLPETGWIALDYADVVIHLFLAETRMYYALETLWRSPRMKVRLHTPAAAQKASASPPEE